MLSILIPTYNYNSLALLDELRHQQKANTSPIEIILCDDFSNNQDSEQANRDYCTKNNITYIVNSTNLGRTATRQKLAELAQYDKLLFLDADVVPVHKDFLNKYLNTFTNSPIIIGGINYVPKSPSSEYVLRWKYGKKRESHNAHKRDKEPYLLVSANMCIDKKIFLQANKSLPKAYGLDAVFGYKLQQMGVDITHIDNPVYHLGLETNDAFLQKSVAAIHTLKKLESKKLLPKNHTRLQRFEKKIVGKKLFVVLLGSFKTSVENNLTGSNPSLLLFDLYRLYHYLKKSNA